MKTIIKLITINPHSLKIGVLVLFIVFASCKKNDSTVMVGKDSYSGSFVKSTATVVTSATGSVTATFDPTTLVLSYTMTWSGLTSNAGNMHFHDAGPVIYPIIGFAAATSGTVSGTVTFNAAQATDLAAGRIYVQIHSVNIPSGEILATLSKNSTSYTPSSGGSGY